VSVSWSKDGKPLKSDGRLRIAGGGELHVLQLVGSRVGDSGDYTCSATNTAGSSYCTVNVIVSGECKHVHSDLCSLYSGFVTIGLCLEAG